VQVRDASKIAALEPLARALPAKLPAGFDFTAAKRAAGTHAATPPATAAALRPGARLRDPHGPLLVYVPAAGNHHAFAIARVEVTRSDYAAFVRATHRPAARCLAAHNPFSRLRHLSWQAPGFEQGGNEPVICVSWDDAAAYAAWLSKTTGEPYRLPDGDEWLRAASGMPKESPCRLGNVDDVNRPSRLDNDRWSCDDGAARTAPVGRYAASAFGVRDMYGNVSEWLAGGGPGSRPFRGVSWRDGSHQTPLGRRGTADADVGYTNVGFRVMRVIDPAHPAPAAASGD
jgi:formylglycine-generating enzyme required for sulfatase activity